MKARSLFYFITFVCILFSGCKKEEVSPETIAGRWYVERYTVYTNSSYYYSDAYEPSENYESVGLFDFNKDGTGIYTFENQAIPFTYTCEENTNNMNGTSNSSFNGISIASGKNVNSNVIYLTFDKSSITSLRSPIIATYYQSNVTRYEVFSKTKGMLRFRTDLNYSSTTSYLNTDNVEFILTRQ